MPEKVTVSCSFCRFFKSYHLRVLESRKPCHLAVEPPEERPLHVPTKLPREEIFAGGLPPLVPRSPAGARRCGVLPSRRELLLPLVVAVEKSIHCCCKVQRGGLREPRCLGVLKSCLCTTSLLRELLHPLSRCIAVSHGVSPHQRFMKPRRRKVLLLSIASGLINEGRHCCLRAAKDDCRGNLET